MSSIENKVNEVVWAHGIAHAAKIEQRMGKPSFEAYTNIATQQTTIRYNPAFALSKAARRFAAGKNVQAPLETCIRDVTSHECGHIPNSKRRACPGTVDDHEAHFYEPIAQVLGKAGKLAAVDAVSNMAEDLIDNTLLAQGAHAGLSLFYADVAESIGWQPAYEAYMRMQLYAWGDSLDHKLLTPHMAKNPEITKAAQSFIRWMERSSGKGRRMGGQEVAAYFADKSNWGDIASAFTQAILPLVPKQLDIPRCGFGKRMEKEMRDPSTRERLARKRYGQGQAAPSWMDRVESLDAVYSSLARQIDVRVEEPRKATSLPLVPFQHEPFDPEEHALSRVDFRRPMVVPEAETPFGIPGFSFGVPRHYIEKPMMVKKGMTSFPEFKCGYLDCSGSMREGIPNPEERGSTIFIPWGDQSKYHYTCRTWYGIVEYLARQGILPNVHITLGVFSSSSAVRHGLEEAKQQLFSPQFGITAMDREAMDELFGSGKSVFFTVSDGDIGNWSDVKKEFIARANGHYYFHIQLGPHTRMTEDLKRAGLPVYTVKSGTDFEQLAIDLTSRAYQSYIDQSLELRR
ncbi:hypothetical protein HY491_01710 [Candidatus Woesearchaeota archaeon]|nr:hypothetical protein [Candidatus Woesearchaeota archaeon]